MIMLTTSFNGKFPRLLLGVLLAAVVVTSSKGYRFGNRIIPVPYAMAAAYPRPMPSPPTPPTSGFLGNDDNTTNEAPSEPDSVCDDDTDNQSATGSSSETQRYRARIVIPKQMIKGVPFDPKAMGYNPNQLYQIPFTFVEGLPYDLKSMGYTPNQIFEIGFMIAEVVPYDPKSVEDTPNQINQIPTPKGKLPPGFIPQGVPIDRNDSPKSMGDTSNQNVPIPQPMGAAHPRPMPSPPTPPTSGSLGNVDTTNDSESGSDSVGNDDGTIIYLSDRTIFLIVANVILWGQLVAFKVRHHMMSLRELQTELQTSQDRVATLTDRVSQLEVQMEEASNAAQERIAFLEAQVLALQYVSGQI